MDRPLSKFALRLALPTLGLVVWAGCGQNASSIPHTLTLPSAPRRMTPTEQAASSSPLAAGHLIPCAADGPVLTAPTGDSTIAEPALTEAATTADNSDPRVTLRQRLRGLDELAELVLPEPKAPPAATPPVATQPAAPPPVAATPVVEGPVALPVGPELQPVPASDQRAARPLPPPVAFAPVLMPEPALESLDNIYAAKPLVPPSDECPQTRLPWADRPIHSAAMEAVTRQANECTQRGYELAARGAMYSARAELIRALRLIAQALDAQHETTAHGKALAAGLRALSEADDFVPRLSRVEAELNVPLLISSHQTPVLKGEPMAGITPLMARQRYYTFAQEQLGAAAGREAAGSLALYALGRIQPGISAAADPDNKTIDPKAVVFYRAALSVDAQNFMAANELGVMLARFGMWREARAAFVQALTVAPQSVTWRNLAIVHQQLGEAELAQRAQGESQGLAARERRGGTSGSAPDVQWVQPEAFAKSSSSTQVDMVQTPKDKPRKTPAPTRK